MAGKTSARHFRLLVDGLDISGDTRQVGAFGVRYAEDDATGLSAGVKNFLLGHPSVFLNGFQAIFDNTAASGSHVELSAQEEYIVSLLMGIRAAPTVGDPAFAAPLQQSSYIVSGEGVVSIEAAFNGPGQAEAATFNENVFGVVLAYGAVLGATTNGTAVDNGASSANGGAAHLHVTASDGGAWAFAVADSPDDISYADLITFSSDGSVVTAERAVAGGTVNRYVRLESTRSSGTVTVTVIFMRL